MPGMVSTGSRQDPTTDTNVISAAHAAPLGTNAADARTAANNRNANSRLPGRPLRTLRNPLPCDSVGIVVMSHPFHGSPRHGRRLCVTTFRWFCLFPYPGVNYRASPDAKTRLGSHPEVFPVITEKDCDDGPLRLPENRASGKSWGLCQLGDIMRNGITRPAGSRSGR